MVSKVHYSSDRTDWETPQELFDMYNKWYSFTLDVCADDKNHKVDKYFTIKEDGLAQDWGKNVCWMNPPYGRGITGKWVKKAYESFKAGATVVCLLPARTDTKWFHEFILPNADINFLPGRIKFVGAVHSAPFPSMIVRFES